VCVCVMTIAISECRAVRHSTLITILVVVTLYTHDAADID